MTDRKLFTPRPYQTIGAEFVANTERCALYAGMGMGKTCITLNVLDALYSVGGEGRPTLVLAPLRVARSTWSKEASKWQHLSGLDVVPVVGTAAERAAALKIDAPIFTTNYDNVVWLREHLGERWPFGTVVADEATRLKSFRLRQGGVRAQALAGIAHSKTCRFIELTGTPAPNGLADLWAQIWFLDSGQRLGRTYSAFMERWFQAVPGGNGYSQVRAMPHAQAEIQERLKDVCLTLDPRDWFDLKEPIVNVITVDLPPKVRAKYREMEKEFYTQINGHEIEAFNAASKSQKLLQLASGAVYVDPAADSDDHPRAKAWTEVHDEKLQALESIVNESGGMPVLVAYHFKSDLARLLKWFPQGRALQTQKDEDDFKAGKVPLLFAHPQSAGHGIDGFQNVSNIIVFFSHWWALENHDQIIERIGPVRQLQAGFDRAVFIYYLVASGTIDELVIDRHSSKRSVQEILLESMKGKKL